MTTDQLRDLIRTRPFRPFILRTADSRAIPVDHPENIAYAGGRTAVVVKPDERIEILDLLLVVSLETAAPSASRGEGDPVEH